MIQNGNITVARIVASCLITLACVGVAGWLTIEGRSIPVELMALAGVGIGGVLGMDVAASVFARRQK